MKRNTCIVGIKKIIKEYGSFDVFQVGEISERPQIIYNGGIWLAESFDIDGALLIGVNDESENRLYEDMTNDELKSILILAERHKKHCESLSKRLMMVDFRKF